MLKPQILTFGRDESRVLVIDGFSNDLAQIRELAKSLSPFPAEQETRYPGRRQPLLPAHTDGFAYVRRTIEACVPFIGQVFGFKGFTLQEASFSLVTTRPEALLPGQTVPHFDQSDPRYLAILHYLSDTPGSGTAFYRHIATGIEHITEGNRQTYLAARQPEAAEAMTGGYMAGGYMAGSTPDFEQTGRVAAVPDRLIIYQGNLLHSGIIPENMSFSEDPLEGRLTGNLFVRGQ